MKISDFKIAEYYIRSICKSYGCPFTDINVEFSTKSPGLGKLGIIVGQPSKLSQTIFQIVSIYIDNIEAITGVEGPKEYQEQNQLLHSVLAVVRDMSYEQRVYPEGYDRLPINKSSLNKQPLVWLLMRDIVCPVYELTIKNVKVVADKTPFIDGAKYVTEDLVGKIDVDESDFPFLFLNLDVENQSYRNAFLFVEAIRAHGLDPVAVVHDIFSKEEIFSKFLGLLKVALVDSEAINNFLAIIAITNRFDYDKALMSDSKTASNSSRIKTAEDGSGFWWYVGLVEKLLEPSRGADWTAYNTLEPATKELWDKVELEKQRRGLDPLPMELLLRVQSKDYEQRSDLTLQGLLADNRVW